MSSGDGVFVLRLLVLRSPLVMSLELDIAAVGNFQFDRLRNDRSLILNVLGFSLEILRKLL
jgi:hypothetical protein